MYSIKNNMISLTRGDTLHLPVQSNSDYVLGENDIVEITVRKSSNVGAEKLFHIIGDSDHVIHILPEHTSELEYGTYMYDIQATLENGDVTTHGPYKFKILPEVTY